MADNDFSDKKELAGRAGHSPQHASEKHTRQLPGNMPADAPAPDTDTQEFTDVDNSGSPEPDAADKTPQDTAAEGQAKPLQPEDDVDMSEPGIPASDSAKDAPAKDEDDSYESGPQLPTMVKVGGVSTKPDAAAGKGPWHWIKTHKKVSIPVAVLVVLAVLAAVPYTRYVLAGTVVRKNFSVLVTDSQTHKPVTSAQITLEGKTAATNNKGIATVKANVGHATLEVSKKYYTSASKAVLVPIGKQKTDEQISLAATGRQVPVIINNKLTGKPVANITLATQDTEAKSDAKGELTLVLPAGKDSVDATLKGEGYNGLKVTVKVTQAADPANIFQIVPSGKLYFLSNQSGTIDVVKADLDGANRKTVLAGTGKEDKYATTLVASADWKYLALLSSREGVTRLYLINTADDSHITMDEGAGGNFGTIGWAGHYFVYTLTHPDQQQWQPGRQAIKSYDADNSKDSTIDQTAAGGNGNPYYFYESLGGAYVLDGKVVYTKNVVGSSANDVNGHQASLNVAEPDGSDKSAVKSWGFTSPFAQYYGTVNINVTAILSGANTLSIASNTNPQSKDPDTNMYLYQNGKITAVPGKTSDDLSKIAFSDRYIISPSGSKAVWTEVRDGKSTVFIGDSSGAGGKQVPLPSGDNDYYGVVGWYSDKYLLLTKGSEWDIVPVSGGTPVKVTGISGLIYYGITFGYFGY
jgi:hypothetical protein